MKRKEFVKYLQTGKSNGKSLLKSGKSVTDPTFARSGRDLIFNPLNIEYRMKYPEGTPLDKENPYNIQEYDKLYPDTFKAIRVAKNNVSNATKNLDKIQEQSRKNLKPNPKPNPNPNN